MTRTTKIIIGLCIFETALTAYYFYAQPLCEPCLPGVSCLPCISESQIITFWTGILIAAATIFYLLFFKKSHAKTASSKILSLITHHFPLTIIHPTSTPLKKLPAALRHFQFAACVSCLLFAFL